MVLRKGRLGQPELDLDPVSGMEAMALAFRLTKASYAMAGQDLPSYPRDRIPCAFVPRDRR